MNNLSLRPGPRINYTSIQVITLLSDYKKKNNNHNDLHPFRTLDRSVQYVTPPPLKKKKA